MSETRETVEKLKQELQAVRAANVARDADPHVAKSSKTDPFNSAKARGRTARAAASGAGQDQLSLDVEALGMSGMDRTSLASAVQTTRMIIAEHG